uniref:Uncharacterized protein n=1 Tax=Anopheles darlingi TaxID=43151 RepID=A0A2M4DCK4_ANODA
MATTSVSAGIVVLVLVLVLVLVVVLMGVVGEGVAVTGTERVPPGGGCFGGGDEAGVLNSGPTVIRSRKLSSCRSDSALWSVSSGRIGGTPPNPDGEAVLGTISRRLGADELPLMTAVLNRLLVLVAIFLLNVPSILK